MERSHFMRGIGLGMLAGTVVGIMVSPGKRELKRSVGKTAQAVGSEADNISQAMKH